MNEILSNAFSWIREDWKSHRARFAIEVLAWPAWTRRSFDMLANYLLLTTIATIGLLRML